MECWTTPHHEKTSKSGCSSRLYHRMPRSSTATEKNLWISEKKEALTLDTNAMSHAYDCVDEDTLSRPARKDGVRVLQRFVLSVFGTKKNCTWYCLPDEADDDKSRPFADNHHPKHQRRTKGYEAAAQHKRNPHNEGEWWL